MTPPNLSRDQQRALHEVVGAERERTKLQIARLAREFDDIVASSQDANIDDEHDPEGSTIAYERQKVAALIAEGQARLAALDLARERMRIGVYGTCDRCGSPVGFERLRALPTARTCVTCA